MQVERHSGKDERRVLIGMITDKGMIAKISAIWEDTNPLFASRWANIIGKWCAEYFLEYGESVKAHIESIFEVWAESHGDKDTIAVIEKFLSGLSSEYERDDPYSSQYLIDLAGKHFNKVRLNRLSREISGELDRGRLDKAEALVNNYSTVRVGVSGAIDLLTAKEDIIEAFAAKEEPLLVYPGDLGRFFGNAFERDAFIAFEGGEKQGKSFWLLDVAWRAMLQKRRVAVFECGDMSKAQVIRRFMARASQRPIYPQTVRYPKAIRHKKGKEDAQVRFQRRHYRTGLDWRTAYKACQKVMRYKLRTKQPLLKLSCSPADTQSVAQIKSMLQTWEREEGWVPDLVVIDYSDILAPPSRTVDQREQINRTWMQLRALSQELHCCVVTATQASAESYSVRTIGKKHFSNDKRKMAHVTGMVGLNAIDEERDNQVMRLNWVVLREAPSSASRCVYVAECRALANPAVRSTF